MVAASAMEQGNYLTLENGHRLWYRIAGTGPRLPLLVLHGGPGAGHDYLENLDKLSDQRPVILYDQLGCGKSDKPDDKSLWRIERFADEIDEVRAQLGLNQVHVLGQSFGGWLLVEYLCRDPQGLASVVLASTSSSMAQFVTEASKCIRQLPQNHQDALQLHGECAEYQHPDYLAAVDAFNRNFLCRMPVWPDSIVRTGANLDSSRTYVFMNGPNEFTVIGNLKDWDRSSDIKGKQVPALITCGEFDELGPDCAGVLHGSLPNSEMRIFPGCSHTAHLEDEENYLAALRVFLRVNDR
jgi:proline-specific peptidase